MTKEKPPKIFSLADADELVPLVADLTTEVVHHLDGIRQQYQLDVNSSVAEVPESVLNDVETALREWSEKVMELGAFPKGYFTVDFQSVNPELLYCWTYGEDQIAYTHKVWENFAHRRPLESSLDTLADHLKWVN